MNDPRAQEAKRLKGVLTLQQIADKFGVSRTTVCRWVYPGYNETVLRASREAKRRRVGVCESCGGETRYNGVTVNGPSRLCDTCAHTFTHCMKGHLYTPETDLRGTGNTWTCRICRNDYMREWSEKKRREAGVPERDKSKYASRRVILQSERAAHE